MALIPPHCRKGDRIALIAPAGRFPEEKMAPAIQQIEAWGFIPVPGQHVLAHNHQFAGTDEQRLADLQAAINDPAIRAIWAVRGGFGSARIIDQVDLAPLKNDPKWIIGFSDVTVLHNHLHQHLDLVTLHATMPVNFESNSREALQSVVDAITGQALVHQLGLNHPLNRWGQAEAPMVGGNLSMLYSLSGTPSALETNGKVLFIEDLSEYLYHLDRMLNQLDRAGKLAGLAGLVVGAFSDMKDGRLPYGATAEEIIRAAVERYDFPVCFAFPAGHVSDNRAWLHGMECKLEVSDKGTTLSFPATHRQ